jgi:hypothetical protein
VTFVQAYADDLVVLGYSVPSLVPWDGDTLPDLVVGEGGAGHPGKVRVYRNVGTATSPAFGDFVYVQSGDADLVVPGEGCMGAFPRVVYWDADARKDLLVGLPTGNLSLFLNVGTDEAPVLDSGTLLQVGEPGAKTDIHVWARATPTVVDWNNDGKKDLVVGSVDGLIYLFINEGADDAPDFRAMVYVESLDGPLWVPSTRASPVVLDLNGDGKKDILAGNRAGQLIFFPNDGTDAAPTFSLYSLVRADGTQIDLPELPRSRPFICDWNSDGANDVVLGSGDGKVRLYRGRQATGDFDFDGDVDLDDFAVLPDCLDGPGQPANAACQSADLDDDGDIDLVDFKLFQIAFTE